MEKRAYFSVTEFSNIVKQTLELTPSLKQVCVRGEVSGLSQYRAKRHTYFTLKDSSSQLGCVYWNLTDIKDGDAVEVFGRIQVWGRSGQYKFIASNISKVGAGDEKERLEKLKKELEQKGYFLEGNKKPIPGRIQRVALLTSAGGAAVGDVAQTLETRGALVSLGIYDVRVQGESAANTIARRVQEINRMDEKVDVVLITRGGGSKEDLSVFNAEACYEAIHNSAIPVICAIGHERDLSISEMCADLRCITPTDAAVEIANRSSRQMYYNIGAEIFYYIDQKIKQAMAQKERELLSIKVVTPLERISIRAGELREIQHTLMKNVSDHLSRKDFQLQKLALSVESASPFHILDRGYALVYKDEKIADVHSVASGDSLKIMFKEGEVHATVDSVSIKEGERN